MTTLLKNILIENIPKTIKNMQQMKIELQTNPQKIFQNQELQSEAFNSRIKI